MSAQPDQATRATRRATQPRRGVAALLATPRAKLIAAVGAAAVVAALVFSVQLTRNDPRPSAAQLYAGEQALARAHEAGATLRMQDDGKLVAHMLNPLASANLMTWAEATVAIVATATPSGYEYLCVEADNVVQTCSTPSRWRG